MNPPILGRAIKWTGLVIGISLGALMFTLLFASLSFAGSNTGADFLKIPVGARAVGFGNAYTAVANNLDSLHWNVAGMARIQNLEGKPSGAFNVSHMDLFDGNTMNQLGFAMPANQKTGRSFWGVSALKLGLTEQDRRDVNGSQIGSFRASDISVGLAFARNWGSAQWGSHVKYIRQELDSENASGVALDMGYLSQTPIAGLNLGLSVRNLGPKMKFIEEEFNLPLTISVGSVYQVTRPLSIAIDFHTRPYQDQAFLSIGSELVPIPGMSLRMGYLSKLATAVSNSQEDESNRGSFSSVNGISGGVGISVGTYTLDYAFSPFGELGEIQMITLSTTFGGDPDRDESATQDYFDTPDEVIIRIPLQNERIWWK